MLDIVCRFVKLYDYVNVCSFLEATFNGIIRVEGGKCSVCFLPLKKTFPS